MGKFIFFMSHDHSRSFTENMSHDHSHSWSFYLVKYEPRSLTIRSRSRADHIISGLIFGWLSYLLVFKILNQILMPKSIWYNWKISLQKFDYKLGMGWVKTRPEIWPDPRPFWPTRPKPFFYEPEQPEEIFLPSQKYFFHKCVIQSKLTKKMRKNLTQAWT